MDVINNNPNRVGNFTSSEIVALNKTGTRPMTKEELVKYKASNAKGNRTTIDIDFGDTAQTYITECNMERRLGRSLTEESNARPLSWGNLVEKQVFSILGTEYRLCSNETISHETISYWKGSPDAEKFDGGKTVVDVKCPITLKSFCTLVDCKSIDEVRENHKDGEKFYWQLVSNSILLGTKYAELIVYCPYKSELDTIRELANQMDGPQQKNFFWVTQVEDNELPWLHEGGYYKNLNIIRFEVPQADKDFLTSRVLKAGEYLQVSKTAVATELIETHNLSA